MLFDRHLNPFDLTGDAGPEGTDIEETLQLQFLQWTVPQFCGAVMEKVIPALKCNDEKQLQCVLQLLYRIQELIEECVLVPTLWDDGSLPARELVNNMKHFQRITQTINVKLKVTDFLQ